MHRNNDFSPKTKKLLAQRAGYKCCYLGCGQATIGPSREKEDTTTSNTGVAAHIYSASSGKGARRKPPEGMLSEQVTNIENGIWMCQTHGKYIDTDETTFTVQTLRKWKEIGEDVARKMQSMRCDYMDALSKIEQYSPEITEMLNFAQQQDISEDRYTTIDLLLYRKILDLIPNTIRTMMRQGQFSNRHLAEYRYKIQEYLEIMNNNPIEYSFFDKNIQGHKEQMDQLLGKLDYELSMSTFPLRIIDMDYFQMSPQWKETFEGSQQYEKKKEELDKLSADFIESFDSFHRICREKFLE